MANDSILMIDSDMVFSVEDVEKMALTPYQAMTGVYVNTLPPKPPMLFKRIKGDYAIMDIPEEVSPVDACGAGFLYLSKELVQKLPYECCNVIKEGEIEHGEDISLCHRINKLGGQIYCDPSIKLGQVRSKVIYQ